MDRAIQFLLGGLNISSRQLETLDKLLSIEELSDFCFLAGGPLPQTTIIPGVTGRKNLTHIALSAKASQNYDSSDEIISLLDKYGLRDLIYDGPDQYGDGYTVILSVGTEPGVVDVLDGEKRNIDHTLYLHVRCS